MDINGFKAILFDSGRTLNTTRTGHWFITPNFLNIIKNSQFTCTEKQLDEGMQKACEHINKILILFKIAIEELRVEPQEAIFVDDSESNLIAAEEFGMFPILIDRYDTQDLKSKYPIIRSLNELL